MSSTTPPLIRNESERDNRVAEITPATKKPHQRVIDKYIRTNYRRIGLCVGVFFVITAVIITPLAYLICYAITQDALANFRAVPCTITAKSYEEIQYDGLCPTTTNYRLTYTVSARVRDHPAAPDTGYETLTGCYGRRMVCYNGVNPANNYVCPRCELTSVDACFREVTLDLTEYNSVELNVPRTCWRHRLGSSSSKQSLTSTAYSWIMGSATESQPSSLSSLSLLQPELQAGAEGTLIFLHNPSKMVDYPAVPVYWLYPFGVAALLGLWSLYYFLRSGLIRTACRKCRGQSSETSQTTSGRWFVTENDRNNIVLEDEAESCCPCVGAPRRRRSSFDEASNPNGAPLLYGESASAATDLPAAGPNMPGSRSYLNSSRSQYNTVAVDPQSGSLMRVGSTVQRPSAVPSMSRTRSVSELHPTLQPSASNVSSQPGSYRPPGFLATVPSSTGGEFVAPRYAQPFGTVNIPPRPQQPSMTGSSPNLGAKPTSTPNIPVPKLPASTATTNLVPSKSEFTPTSVQTLEMGSTGSRSGNEGPTSPLVSSPLFPRLSLARVDDITLNDSQSTPQNESSSTISAAPNDSASKRKNSNKHKK